MELTMTDSFSDPNLVKRMLWEATVKRPVYYRLYLRSGKTMSVTINQLKNDPISIARATGHSSLNALEYFRQNQNELMTLLYQSARQLKRNIGSVDQEGLKTLWKNVDYVKVENETYAMTMMWDNTDKHWFAVSHAVHHEVTMQSMLHARMMNNVNVPLKTVTFTWKDRLMAIWYRIVG